MLDWAAPTTADYGADGVSKDGDDIVLHPMAQQQFDIAWRVLHREDKCDAPGSDEYHRITKEWRDAGAPPDMLEFILRRANNLGPV